MSTMQWVQKYHILTRYSYLDMICSPSAMGLLQSLGVKWRRWGEWKGQGHGPRAGEEGKLSAESIFPPPMAGPERQSVVARRGEAAHFMRGDPASSPVSPPLRLLAPSKAASRPRQTRPPDQLTDRPRDDEPDRAAARLRTQHHSLQRQAITITGLNRGHTQIRGQV